MCVGSDNDSAGDLWPAVQGTDGWLQADRNASEGLCGDLPSAGCGSFGRPGGATAFTGLGRLHFEGVVEAVEVIEEADGAEQLHDFAFVVEGAQLGILLVAEAVGVAGDGLGESEGGFFSWGKVLAVRPIGQVGQLVVCPAEAASEDGVAGEAIGRDVQLAGADDDQFLELGGDRAGIQDGSEVRLHGGENFGAVRHDAKHVGDVAALGKGLIVERCHIRGNFAAVKPGNPGHRASLVVFLPVSILTLYSAYRISLIGTRDRRFWPFFMPGPPAGIPVLQFWFTTWKNTKEARLFGGQVLLTRPSLSATLVVDNSTPKHSSVAQWQSIRLLTEGL